MIGWAAATGEIGPEPLILFLIDLPVDAAALLGAVAQSCRRICPRRRPHAAGRCRKSRNDAADPHLQRSSGADFAAAVGARLCRHDLCARPPLSAERFFVALAFRLRRTRRGRSAALLHRLFAFSIFYLSVSVCGSVGSNGDDVTHVSRAAATVGSCKRRPLHDRGLHQRPAQTRSDMRYALLAVVLIGAATLGGCTGRRPRSERAHCRRRTANSAQLARDHAGDRDPDDPRHPRRRLLVSLVQQARALPAGLHLFRPSRDARLVDPDHDRASGGRRRLGRLIRPRSAQGDRLCGQARQGSSRLARLEMAVHLSRPGHREPSIS